jgi:hypothetical protein
MPSTPQRAAPALPLPGTFEHGFGCIMSWRGLGMGCHMHQSKVLVDGGSRAEALELARQWPQHDTFESRHGRQSHILPIE